MRIAIDLSPVRTTGTIGHSHGFLPAFAQLLKPEDELFVFAPPPLDNLLLSLRQKRIHSIVSRMFLRVPSRTLWQQSALRGLLLRFDVEVLFSPFDVGPLNALCPIVVGVKNPNPIILAEPNLIGSREHNVKARLHHFLVRRSCRRARSVIFPTRYAANAVGDLLEVPLEKREVANHGLDVEFWANPGPTSPPGCIRPGKYVLFASKFYRQKRALLLLKAFARWRGRYGRGDYELIYSGEEPNSEEARSLLRAASDLGIENDVHILGIVERSTLRELYKEAAVFALPTVLETFGFPYIEAMASGIPLVCADIPVARELCGDVPYYFAADDEAGLTDALERAVHNSAERSARLKAGTDRSRGFSWQREAEETMSVLRAAAIRD